MVYVRKGNLFGSKLLDNQFSGSYFIVLQNANDVHSFVQTGKVQFLTHNSGLQYLGAQHIKDGNLLWLIALGLNKNFTVGTGIWVQL